MAWRGDQRARAASEPRPEIGLVSTTRCITLGRHTAADRATIQGVVRRLIGRGLVHRGRDPLDRRTVVPEARWPALSRTMPLGPPPPTRPVGPRARRHRLRQSSSQPPWVLPVGMAPVALIR